MTVKFEKDGLFEYKWSGKKRDHVRKRVKKISVWKHLRDHCEIAEGVTLLDIFRTVGKYKALKIFVSQYSWCRSIDEFHAQAEEPFAPDDEKYDPMTALEIYWACDLGDSDDKKYIELSPAFHGIGLVGPQAVKHYQYKPDQIGEKMQWGIGFMPMQEIAHLPVVLNTTATFFDHATQLAQLKARETPVPFLVAERSYNLQDVLDAIYWEISFHGGPAQREEMKDKLVGMVDDIKSGVAECVPIGDVFPDLGENPNPNGMKIVLHPDVAKQFGFDPEDQKDTD